MELQHTRICAYCHEQKPWLWSGARLKDGSKIYTGAGGQRWAGRRCPDCERGRVAAAARAGSFERAVIIRQLEAQGFTVAATTLPLKATKDGVTRSVSIKRAHAEGSRIVLEAPVEQGEDLVALVFATVRICTSEQVTALGLRASPTAAAAEPTGGHA